MLPSDAHDSLFSDVVLRVGEIHSYFLAAFSLVRAPRTKAQDGPRLLRKEDRTALAKEIGGDEIHWWVFTKEDDVGQLSERTERALAAAQTLKEGSAALMRVKSTHFWSSSGGSTLAIPQLRAFCLATECGARHDGVTGS